MTRLSRVSPVLRSLSALLALALPTAGAAEDVRDLRIDDQARFWREDGYHGLVPSIHLPTTHGAGDLIHVWLHLPPGGQIDARYLKYQDRYTLVFPPGTRADRVEYYRIRGEAHGEARHYATTLLDEPSQVWTVADVRGTTIEADGSQRFHVLRPVSGEVHADLVGWSWPRGDAAAQALANYRLAEHARSAARPKGRPPMSGAGLERLIELNDCAGCHAINRPRHLDPPYESRALSRATDAMGFYVPIATLRDECIVANHRPEDLNAEDPYVTVRCDGEPARLETADGPERFVCPGDRVPMGYRDVEAALAANHPYTERMCEVRRYLYAHMTPTAREAFAEPFALCGIGQRAGGG